MSSVTLNPSPAKRSWFAVPAAARRGQFAAHLVVFIAVTVGMFFAHELGHALAALLFNARIVMFNVLGMQWFPSLEWMPELGFGGFVYWFAPPNVTNHRLILLAGSTFTLLLAVGAVTALNIFPIRGIGRTALAALSFYFLDSLVHALPMLGLIPAGWNSRFTRSFSEAYFAFIALGVPSELYLGAILLLAALVPLLLLRALRR